jgi:hypothetical protein
MTAAHLTVGEKPVGRVRRVAFVAVAAFLTAGLVTKFWKVNLFPLLVWLPDDVINHFYGYALAEMSIHRIHYLALALSHLLVTIGVAIQLWRPTRWVAPMWQASGATGLSVLLLVVVRPPLQGVPPFVFVVLVVVILMGFVHPDSALRRLPRPHDRPMTLLWLLMVVPTLVYTIQHIGLQVSGSAGDPHWSNGHYQMVAEYGLHLVLVGLLGASALRGWRVTGWCAASMAGVMGAAFIVFPDSQSSGGVGWGLGLLAWAVAYATATERRARENRAAEPQRLITR